MLRRGFAHSRLHDMLHRPSSRPFASSIFRELTPLDRLAAKPIIPNRQEEEDDDMDDPDDDEQYLDTGDVDPRHRLGKLHSFILRIYINWNTLFYYL